MPYQNSPEPMCPRSILAPELKKSDAPAIFFRVLEISKNFEIWISGKGKKFFFGKKVKKSNVFFTKNSVF